MLEKTDFSTPLIPQSSAVAIFKARTSINASASLVFRTLRNTETWKDWNRFVPRVVMNYQPDETDDVTAAEIEELVRNTSLAVTHDSELNEVGQMKQFSWQGTRRGSLPYGGSGTNAMKRPSSGVDPDDIPKVEFVPPPVTRHRLASNASRFSDSAPRAKSMDERRSSSGLSAAQKFQASREGRNSSVASAGTPSTSASIGIGTSTAAAAIASTAGTAVMLEAPGTNQLLPAPRNTEATLAATQGRRKSGLSEKVKKQLHLNALYGEPSVRIQVGTKMTLHCKMKLPSPHFTREFTVLVGEVSRPDDNDSSGDSPFADFNSSGLNRMATHTLSASGVYRLVWTLVTGYPKFILQMQRVHEIRPVIDGAGNETCEYWDWEVWRGVQAKKYKKEHGEYVEKWMGEWGKALGEFCESMGGAVERRDFSVS